MEQFEFKKKGDDLDYRSLFANRVCKLLVEKHKGNFIEAISELEPLYKDFEENIRNIYELIDSEIPLFALYDLLRLDADNWGFEVLEYKNAIINSKKACEEYYL